MFSPTTPSEVETLGRFRDSTLGALAEGLRPGQWIKNGFVFAALIFSRRLTSPPAVLRVGIAAAEFCLIASAVYLLNDVLDLEEDREHPVKRRRPVASGRLSAAGAHAAAIALATLALGSSLTLDRDFFFVIAIYAGLNTLYSAALKHVALVDVFVIAAGFVLRVIGGGLVIHVELSPWLIVCTTLLALFLALSKRRYEMVLLGEDAAARRPSLAHYSPYFLDQLIGIVTACTVMSYALYTLSADVRAKFPGKRLELTVPFVLFGIFRYLYLVHQRAEGGNPARLLLADAVLLLVVLMWAASIVLIIYG